MFWRPEDSVDMGRASDRVRVVVAGPGSTLTIPGIIVSEIVRAIAKEGPVTRLEVDPTSERMQGLDRAQSLVGAHFDQSNSNVVRVRAPIGERDQNHTFKDVLGPDVAVSVAYAWPGMDNSWIRSFLRISKNAGALTIVACASLPASSPARVTSLAEVMSTADRIYVGDIDDATSLATMFGSRGPVVEAHPALSLKGKNGRAAERGITTFLPRDSASSLSTLLAAFDAIPEAWIADYRLRVVMRYTGEALPDLVAASHHAKNVLLIGDDMSAEDIEEICTTSSALSVADPEPDSRAFTSAVSSGIATVVLTSSLPKVGNGYVGGLLADLRRPSSVNVALHHALRLEELHFPSPRAWDRLARRLRPTHSLSHDLDVVQAASSD
jgi:hypothetical protein